MAYIVHRVINSCAVLILFSGWYFAEAQHLSENRVRYKPLLKNYDLSMPLQYPNEKYLSEISLFSDSVKKERKKNCCNSWCFGTSFTPLLNIVSYNSFLLNEKVKFKGLKLGAELGERIRFGFGGYRLDNPIDLPPLLTDVDTINRQLRFEYYNVFLEFVFYEDFRWELAIPFSMGRAFGKIDTFSVKNNNKRGQINVDSTGLATFGFDFEYRFIPWLGLGGGVGYRQAFAPRDIREKLNAPFYTVKIKVFLGYLFKAVFMRKKLAAEKEEYFREKEERKKKRKNKKAEREEVDGANSIEGLEKDKNVNDF